MWKLSTRDDAHIINGLATPQPFISVVLMWCVHIIGTWFERQSQRHALVALEDYRLKDIGLSREQVRREASKPFWKR
jgi:uncharacterized protein YjiS (DUF1127 family)